MDPKEVLDTDLLKTVQSLARPKKSEASANKKALAKAKILDATVMCLYKNGYAGTTNSKVAERAGVSVGQVQNFFPTKNMLLAAAAEYALQSSLDTIIDDFLQIFEGVFAGKADPITSFLVRLILIAETKWHYAYTEVAIVARTNPDLYELVQPLFRDFVDRLTLLYSVPLPPMFHDICPNLHERGLVTMAAAYGASHLALAYKANPLVERVYESIDQMVFPDGTVKRSKEEWQEIVSKYIEQ